MEELYRPIRILLVEDNPEDVAITQRALAKSGLRHKLHIVTDGQEALDYLNHAGDYGHADRPSTPDFVLLDLNLPLLDGREVLRLIKADPKLRRIPVIVLTTSPRDEDVLNSYDLGVNTYIRKPVSFDRFMEVVQTLHDYWVMVATLPSHPGVDA